MEPVRNLTSYLTKIKFNIIFPSEPGSSKQPLSFTHFRATCLAHYILLKSIIIIFDKEYRSTKVFGFVGTDHLRTKIIITDETLEQVRQFTYLGFSVSYQFSNDVESKLAKFLQLIGTIKRTILRK